MHVHLNKWLAIGAAGVLSVGVAACGSDDKKSDTASSGDGGATTTANVTATLNGAGSTFAAPIYSQWGSELKNQGLTVNYQGVGSGAGIAQLAQGTVQWAGSDPALTEDDIKSLTKGTPAQFPVALGAITASYNLPGVDSGLKLDGEVLANIFLGKIKKWNDPAIAALNDGVDLPDSDITVVHRSDESGTTKGFTTFLGAYSKEWTDGPGVDKTVKWPTGTGAKGNDGVAAAIKQTEGSIGYVEQAYALQNNFTFADVKNKAGKFVAPTLESTTAAADGVDVPEDLGISVIDSPNPEAYPIASQTFVDTYQDLCKGAGMDENTAKGFVAFMNYALGDGQEVAKQLSYAPLPDSIKSKVQEAVTGLQCNGAAVAG
jgi:phosphate transport system substrate-binding protein